MNELAPSLATSHAEFHSPHNICVGRGRVLWANATNDSSGRHHLAGWVLPGGRRTQSRDEALAVALRIDQLIN